MTTTARLEGARGSVARIRNKGRFAGVFMRSEMSVCAGWLFSPLGGADVHDGVAAEEDGAEFAFDVAVTVEFFGLLEDDVHVHVEAGEGAADVEVVFEANEARLGQRGLQNVEGALFSHTN